MSWREDFKNRLERRKHYDILANEHEHKPADMTHFRRPAYCPGMTVEKEEEKDVTDETI